MLGNQIENLLVVRCGQQPIADRYPRRASHRLYPTPVPQSNCRQHSIIPNRYDKLGTSITGDEDQ